MTTSKRKIIVILLIIGTVLLGGAVTTGFGVYTFFNYLMAPANTFFTTLREQGVPSAYALTSARFQEQVTVGEFTEFIKTNDLDAIKKTRWNSSEINGDTGTISGSIERTDGSRIPATVNTIKENDVWKIYHITLDGNSTPSLLTTPPLPSSDEALSLAEDTWQSIATYALTDNYDDFYQWVSPTVRSSYSRTEFAVNAKDYLDSQTIQALKESNVSLEQDPTYDKSTGVYRLYGKLSHPDTSYIYFRLAYTYDDSDWKLLNFVFDSDHIPE